GDENDAVKYGPHVGRRLTDDAQDLGRRRLPSQCLITFAAEPRDLCFMAESRGTAHALWRNTALARCRLSTLRFSVFAASSGAPSHCRPSAQDKAGQPSTLGLASGTKSPIGVIKRHAQSLKRSPVLPQYQTSFDTPGTSVKCRQ